MASILTAQQREQLHRQFDEVLDRLPAKLENLGDAKEQLQSGMRQLAQASMQSWAETASTASSPPACPDCGYAMRHRGLARRTLVTLHGAIVLSRPRRRCDRCGKESYPHDTQLCFRSHGVSWHAAAKVSQLASLLPSYELSRRLLVKDHAIELSKHSVEAIVLEVGQMLLRALEVYLKNNAERMDYARYRAAGLPIGSGPVEAACKYLVGARCKQAGMRNWRREGAEAVLRLRAAQYDDEFDPLWDARLRRAA